MQFADVALGQRHDLHASKRHLLMKAGDVLLVMAQPVQRLREDHLEAAAPRVGKQLLEAWS